MKTFLLCLCCVLAACSDRLVGPDVTDDEAILIAYFAELMEREPWGGAAAYCISTGTWPSARQDVTDAVRGDLRTIFGKVQQGSTCVYSSTGVEFNGDASRAYHVETVVRSGNTATVTGLFFENPQETGTYRGQVDKQGDLWVVSRMDVVAP